MLWGIVTLILVYVILGKLAAWPFSGTTALVVGNVVGIAGVVAYLAAWRWWFRHKVAPPDDRRY
jgi:hypothetical protein